MGPSEDSIQAFQRDGFVVVEDLVDPDELERYGRAVDLAVQTRMREDHRVLEQKTRYEQSFQQCINLWEDSLEVRQLTFDARLGEMAAQLLGADAVRIWHDQALYKDPWANPTSWHQDNTKWSFSAEHAITIWVALDEVDARNGCMFFLPGTHRRVGEGEDCTARLSVYNPDHLCASCDNADRLATHEAEALERLLAQERNCDLA